MTAHRTPGSDRAAIREILDGWIVWRDCGRWDELLRAWHPAGRMSSTRFDGTAEDFVAETRRGFHAGSVRHTQSGWWCRTAGDRGVSMAGMSIMVRAQLHGIPVAVTCLGSFVNFLSYRDGRWALDRRQPAYDHDWILPVVPGAEIALDQDRLAAFPTAYRHLAYLQESMGHHINTRLPEMRGPSFEALMAEASEWLASGHAAGTASAVRRVVVAENAGGESEVAADEADAGPVRSPVPGLHTRVIWATGRQPDHRHGAVPVQGIVPPTGGTRFAVLSIEPGYRSASLHRTDTIDYVLCLDGQVDMLLDRGSVTLRAGDVAVQRGANHGWENRSDRAASVAVVLVDAHPKRSGSISGDAMAP